MLRPFWILAALPLLASLAPGAAEEPAWKYVADDVWRPVPRTVALSTAKPGDLREDVAFRGKTRKYAQIRYGSEDSRRVAVVIDEVSSDDWDLYIDADRNRVLETKDKITGAGRERSGRLDVEITRGLEILHEARTVQWRLGATRTSISLATLGYVAGVVRLDGKPIAARRVDGDANGFFADAADRLWLDLNGDGQWDPLSEQFPLLPVLTLWESGRYAVRGDAGGAKLALEPLTAEGRIRLRLGQLAKEAMVVKLHVMLVGEDGSAIGITSVDAPIVVPAGKYALGAVSLSARHGELQPTHFVFSGGGDSVRWHTVKKDQELVVDPIGKLRFELKLEPDRATAEAGAALYAQPRLFTADGLLINSCAHGDSELAQRHDGGPSSFLKVYDAQRQLLSTATSGFV